MTSSQLLVVPSGWPEEVSVDKLHECVAAFPPDFHAIAGAILGGAPPPPLEELVEGWTKGEACADTSGQPSDPEHARCHDPITVLGVTGIAGVGTLAPAGYRGFTDGLNIVFGENGSGKSSLAAIIKEAGASRLPADVLANVYADDNPPASATIHLSVGGEELAHEWAPNKPDARLRRVRVYDADCGDSYVERGAEAHVLPGPVQVVAALVRFAGELRTALLHSAQSGADVPEVPPDTPVFDAWANGDAERLRALAQLGAPEEVRLAELRQSEHVSDNALLGDAAAWRAKAQSLEEMRAVAMAALESFDSLAEFRERRHEVTRLRADLTSADAVVDASGRQLRRLLVAADISPGTADTAVCPLCARAFDDDELAQFLERVRASRVEDQIMLDEAELELEITREGWRTHAVRLRELEGEGAVGRLGDWLRGCAEALDALASDRERESVPSAPDLAALETEAAEARARASSLGAMATEGGDRAGELRDLEARVWIRDNQQVVAAALEARARSSLLEADAKRLDTKKLSRLHGKLTETLLTQEYQSVLVSHLETMLPNIELHVSGQVRKGAVQHQAILTQANKGTKVASVLSEGERRLAGLAFFLTEAEVFGNGETLLLDDPVSSMDESRRDQVALKLARLARERQVIVVTHDLVFVEMLKGHAKPDHVHECEVQRFGSTSGFFGAGIQRLATFKAGKSKLNRLHQDLAQDEKKIAEATDAPERADAQRRYEATQSNFTRTLRQTLERFIEEKLLLGVVTRFSRGVGVSQLREISVTPEQVDLVRELMSASSLDLHDSSDALPCQPPDAKRAKALAKRLAELEATTEKPKSKHGKS